jgi:hypothetical protein
MVQLSGDAHLSNFGGFASPERSMLFDINDFDETSTGPFEWDVKRLAAGLEVAARDRGGFFRLLRRPKRPGPPGAAEGYRRRHGECSNRGLRKPPTNAAAYARRGQGAGMDLIM